MEIIKIGDSRYDEYEKLLLEREQYTKDAKLYLRAYIREFGELTTDVFKEKIACIEKKKMLSFCMIYKNRGERVDINAMQEYIEQEMAEYQQQLDSMIENNLICKMMRAIPDDEVLKIKQIYRRIAKRLHPDINPLTMQIPELMELWRRNITAYQCNDLKELEELEVLVEKALGSLGEDSITITIEDIDEKIKSLYAEIEKIRSTDPYRYKFLLEDKTLVAEKKAELESELKEYRDYRVQLEKQLKQFIAEGGTFEWKN
jgi:hypothetical protein